MPDPTPSGRPKPSTRELWAFVAYYNEHIKAHSKEQQTGVLRNIQLVLDKLDVEDVALALENYAADPWRKANPRFSKHIRSFFTYEVVKEWLKPVNKVEPDKVPAKVRLFQPLVRPEPAQITVEDQPLLPSLDDL